MTKISYLLLFVLPFIKGECLEGCNEPHEIYYTLGCKPIYKNPADCCPFKFDCSSIENRPADKCTYKGKSFSINEEIPKELTYSDCQIGCRCIGKEKTICAVLDCPEWLGRKPKPGCQLKYEVGQCCSVGEICPPYEECKVDGETYKEGERFYPKSKRCTKCVCKKGFTGELSDTFCEKSKCTDELRKLDKIKEYCAPAYLRDNDCCPFDWICPEDNDNIVVSKNQPEADLQCKYGSKTLNVGDLFERTQHNSEYERWETKCECRVPPFVTCTKKQIFDLDKAPEHLRAALAGNK